MIGALIRKLAALGMTIEQIASAVDAVEYDRDEKLATRREQNRKAQQNHRARQHDGADGADRVNALSFLSKEVIIKESKKEIAAGRTLPTDWHPSDSHYQLGEKHGLDRGGVDLQANGMREWAGANRNRAVARKADWDLTFNGWLRRNGSAAAVEPAKMTPEEYHRKFTGGDDGKDGNSSIDGRGAESPDNSQDLFPTRRALHSDDGVQIRRSACDHLQSAGTVEGMERMAGVFSASFGLDPFGDGEND